MNINEVSKAAGLPAKTIRYYEEIGLIRPLRGANGYRAFRDSDMHKLSFIARARGLGFSIEECRKLLALYDDKARASADVKALAEGHLRDIATKIEALRAMEATLRGPSFPARHFRRRCRPSSSRAASVRTSCTRRPMSV